MEIATQQKPEVIYCAGGNSRLAQIAIDAGMLYGARLPGIAYHPIYFADQDWKKPDLDAYASSVEGYGARFVTILDWEREEQEEEVFAWANRLSKIPTVEIVAFIPKAHGTIDRIPSAINGKKVILAYSVPTRYGGTTVPLGEFGDREVHLLGGHPHDQIMLCKDLNVISADGNMMQKMAIERLQSWRAYGECDSRDWWYELADDYLTSFSISCRNIVSAWRHWRELIPLFLELRKLRGFRRYKHSNGFYLSKCREINDEIQRLVRTTYIPVEQNMP